MRPRSNEHRRFRGDKGLTLVELLIGIMVMGMVTSAVAATMSTTLQGTASISQKVRESNDAQLISSYLTRDAQAVGGLDPSSGGTDGSLGISATDADGCTGTGALVLRFKWNDRSGATTTTNRVTYFFDAGTNSLTRHFCTGATNQEVELGREVASAAPSCTPACSGIPEQISVTITETNSPTNASSPYQFTLAAAVRAEGKTAANATTAAIVPLMALGTTCPSSALQVSGTGPVSVNGIVVVNSGCTGAMSYSGTGAFTATETRFLAPGTCTGTHCFSIAPIALSPAVTDPLSGLVAPAGNCSGGSNPAAVGTHRVPGVYPLPLSITTTAVFDPGTYVLCQGLSLSATAAVTGTGVFMYVPAGASTVTVNSAASVSLSAPASGTYEGVLLWQVGPTTMPVSGGPVANTYNGIVYAPSATVNLTGGIAASVGSIVAKAIVTSGSINATFGPVALSITGPASLANGAFNTAYTSVAFTAAGGTPNYTWTATGLPSGFAIDPTSGVISGTTAAIGVYSVIVTVTDSLGQTDNSTLSLTVSPVPLSVQLVNGGSTLGKAERGDTIVVTYSSTMSVNSFCSAWTNDAADQLINGNSQVVVTLTNGTGSSNDTITVTSTTCTFNFGVIDLGNPGFTTNTRTFKGTGANGKSTIAWDASANQLTIRLGTASGAVGTVLVNSVAIYTPDADIKSATGLPIAGTAVTGNVRQF